MSFEEAKHCQLVGDSAAMSEGEAGVCGDGGGRRVGWGHMEGDILEE